MSELKIRTVPIEALSPDPLNVRTHDAKNLEAITRSLHSFGQRKPIVVTQSANGLTVIAGNGTLEAAKALGWTEIVITEVPRDWDPDKARAYAIADNRSAELAEWDKVKLASALLELEAVGWDPITVGFDTVNAPGDPVAGSVEQVDKSKPATCCPSCGFKWTIGPDGEVEVVE